MSWTVLFHEEFESEFDALASVVQDELYAEALFLEKFGPETGRPHVDTLKGSRYPNMKELRFEAADGEWRVAFAFDPARRAVLLVAGDKTGISERRFYRRLIGIADARYGRHLDRLKKSRSRSMERKGP
jgi:hypothetical protein